MVVIWIIVLSSVIAWENVNILIWVLVGFMTSTPQQVACYSGDEIKNNEIGGACGMCGVRRDAYRDLVGKREGNKLEDTIKMDI